MMSFYQKEDGVQEKNKSVPVRFTEDEHRGLKVLAAKKGISIQQLFISALDKLYPNWRKGEENK